MRSFKLILGLALLSFVFVLNSHCKQLGHPSIKTTHEQNGSKPEKKVSEQLDSHNQDRKKTTTAHAKTLNAAHSKASSQRTEKSTPTKIQTHQKSGIKTRSTETKEKKYSLSFSPNPQSQNYQPQDNVGFSQEQSSQQQYFSSPYGEQSQAGEQSNQETEQQQGYSTLNGGQDELSKFQGDSNGEANENGQNIGMLQSLMEQRAAMYGQEEGNQDGEQRSYNQQQLASYQQQQEQQNEEQQGQQDDQQGQQQDEQQGQQQEEQQRQQQAIQQYQQNMDRENAQQMNMQEGQGQEGQGQEGQVQEGQEGREGAQEFRMPQDQEGGQQGSNPFAAYTQEPGEQGEQQAGQMQEQQPGPESEPQPQQGEAEGGFMMKEAGQEQSYKGGEDPREAYQKGGEDSREAYQQGGEETQQPPEGSLHGIDGGSISSLFADANSQNGQDTQSLIKEGQSITSSDAAQLAEAIANANKGLKGFKSLSSAASENNGALSFTGGESAGPEPLPDKKEGGEAQIGSNMLYPETQSYSNEFPSGMPSKWSSGMNVEANYDKGPEFAPEQEYHHEHRQQEAYHERENQPHFFHADPPYEHQRAKYCTGCPRNSRCIDKVCIINGDEPLARILGALSGPENQTSDCKGCHHNARCVKKECICKPGFNGNGTECKADSCLPGCSKHGKCIRGFCVCDHSHYFNGVECAPYKISQTECPSICKTQCLPHCPDKCCRTPTSPSTNGKKEASDHDTASAFFLKPTFNQAVDLFHKHPSHGKDIDHHKPTESSVEQMDHQSTTPLKTTNTMTPTAGRADKPTQPNLKVNQMDFLKSIAEKFCPSQCQKSCSSGCPPVCCDKKTLASILTGSPGTSMVDMSKAEDVFRNAMGWFGMMNLIHMMYTMYGKNKPNIGIKVPGLPSQNVVAPKPSASFDTCSPICKKECLLSCPTSCCAANATKRTNPKPNVNVKPVTAHPQVYQQAYPQARLQPYRQARPQGHSQAQVRQQTYQPTHPQPHQQARPQAYQQTHPQKGPQAHLQAPSEKKAALGITRCPFVCSRQCLPLCPKTCCKQATSKSTVNTKSTQSCKPGCSPKCYPHCTEYCCKFLPKQPGISKTTQAQNKAVSSNAHACPAQCPKRCYPSCTKDCCSSKYTPKSTENHGQYYVNIRCPNECRPFNCLSYCHHECCLGKNSVSSTMKVKSMIASKPSKSTS